MGIDLPLIWAIIIGFGLMMYIIMDGFDLGIGLLFPFVKNKDDRDAMINSIAPVWDGNETWLVLGGAALFAAFPAAYALILSALYLPLLAMLAGLIWRGVAFEFRFKADDGHKPFWDKAFIAGSYLATFAQGITLGAFINGFTVKNGLYTGGTFDWLTPFSIMSGLGLLSAYALLGASWLIMKTSGNLQDGMRRIAKPVTIVLFLFIAITSLWTPISHPNIASRWFSAHNIVLFAPVPILVLAVTILMIRILPRKTADGAPFALALFLVFLGYSGLAISLWPNIIPPEVSIWRAAAPSQSLGFTLVGTLFIIPVILTYTAWSYHVFRGKVEVGDGYH